METKKKTTKPSKKMNLQDCEKEINAILKKYSAAIQVTQLTTEGRGITFIKKIVPVERNG